MALIKQVVGCDFCLFVFQVLFPIHYWQDYFVCLMQPYHLYHKVFEERADAAKVCKLGKLANS